MTRLMSVIGTPKTSAYWAPTMFAWTIGMPPWGSGMSITCL